MIHIKEAAVSSPSVYLLRKPWEWKAAQAAGKMSRNECMVVVESHRYNTRSARS